MRHEELRDLILVFEDLGEDDKILAEAHLAECESCRKLLISLQRTEQVDAGLGDLPVDPSDGSDPLNHLSSDEQTAARISRQKLLTRVQNKPVHAGSQSSNTGWWRRNSTLYSLAVAACLALVIWMPWQNNPQELVQGFRVTTPAVVRGEGSDLKPGDAFVVRFQMEDEGWPVVVQIIEEAAPLLVFPTADDPPFQLPAGRAVVLPPPGSQTVWTVDETASVATYLVSIVQSGEPDVVQLQALMSEAAQSTNATEAASSLLVEKFGNCQQFGGSKH